LESLFVWNFTEGVVRVVALEYWVKTAVSGIEAEGNHVAPEGSVTELSFNKCEVLAVDFPAYLSFKEDSETFVEPEALPVSASDGVTSP